MDEEKFFYFRTWEIMFPAIIQKKFLSFLGRIDQRLGGIGGKTIRNIEAKRLKHFNKMHQTGLFFPEECELLLIHIFSSYNILFYFPVAELNWFHRFDISCPPADRKRIMTFYRECVKRQAFFKGNKGRLLSKSPGFTPKIQSLYEYFPGCSILCMIRNPLEVVPSMLNLVSEICKSAKVESGPVALDKAYEMAKFYYHYPLSCFEQVSESTFKLVQYDELVRNPSKLVRSIYRQFNFSLNSRYADILRTEDQKAKAYKSRHRYSLDQFHLTREQIIADLKEIFNRFGFSTEEKSDSEN